jgi:eukaryotic-like serine/threonine-protein kinase
MRTTYSFLSLGNQLGCGHFGIVHEGEHPVQGKIAVKMMERLNDESDTVWQQRKMDLLSEAQHLKVAEHERVVRVFDISHDVEADRIYLALERCNGSLGDLYEKGPIEVATLRGYLSDAASGLCGVHSNEIIHRDLKPSNILIGCDGRAKLGDFGLVTDRLILGYGSMAGYSDHIAHEVWQNEMTSKRSDIWAFGMTTYRLLLGKILYESMPANDAREAGYADRLSWFPHIPKRWRSFVRKCLRDVPSERFQSAEAMLSAITALPIEPSWTCSYSSGKTEWRRHKGNREIIVTYYVHSPRKHEWRAMSKPLSGSGRNRTLASSAACVPRRQALSEIENFLGST